jgi:ABC-type Zn uptake system ZnuABC Zn-binding protein ZnuA
MQRLWLRLLVAMALLTGCDRSPSSPGGAGGPPKRRVSVLATTYPLAEIAKRVGGSWADVQWLLEAGRRPEEIETTPEVNQRANKVDLVITGGPWDDWAQQQLSTDARSRHLIEPDRMPSAQDADPKAYLWLNADVIRDVIETLRVRITLIEPRHEVEARANATACATEVETVDREIAAQLAGLKGRKVLVARPVWGAMLARYGLEQVAPVDVSEEKLTPEDFRRITSAAKAAGAKSIFVDAATPAGVRQQIEDRTGLKVLTLDAVGSSAPEGRNTWPKLMRYNAEQLKAGLN